MATLTSVDTIRVEFVNALHAQLASMGIHQHPDFIDQGGIPYVMRFAEKRKKNLFVNPLIYVPCLGEFKTSHAQKPFFRNPHRCPIDIDYGRGGYDTLATRFRKMQRFVRLAFDEAGLCELKREEIDQRVEMMLTVADSQPDSETTVDLLLYAGVLANGYGSITSTHSCFDILVRAAKMTTSLDVRAMIIELATLSLPSGNKAIKGLECEVLATWTAAMPAEPDPVFDIVRAYQGISLAMTNTQTMPLAQPFYERMIAIHQSFLQRQGTARDDGMAIVLQRLSEDRLDELPRIITDNTLRMALALVSGSESDGVLVERQRWGQAAVAIESAYEQLGSRPASRKNRMDRKKLQNLAEKARSTLRPPIRHSPRG